MEDNPKLWASFRYFSIHSLLIWLARLYLASECIFLADFSNFCRLSSLLSKKMYWLYMWLQLNSKPTGAANDRRQSLRSVDSFSKRVSADTVPGRSSVSERV